MPALPDAPGVLRVALSGPIVGGGDWLSRFFMHYAGSAPTNAQLATWNTAVASAYTSDLKPLIGNNVELTEIETIDLSSSTSAIATTAEAISGSRTGAALPSSASVVTSYEIQRRYRGGHPRGYWPMGVEGDITDDSHWSSTFVASVLTGITAFYTALIADGWTGAGTLTQVNVSYYSGFTVVTSPTTGRARNVPKLRDAPIVDTVQSYVVRPSIGTQRRRLKFAG